jgi:hypothetical protein
MFYYPIETENVYISEPIHGKYFIAERSPKGHRGFLWSSMPVEPTAGPSRVQASRVPLYIRKEAYRKFNGQKDQERKQAQKAVKWTSEGWDKIAGGSVHEDDGASDAA